MLVQDRDGASQIRRRFLLQLCAEAQVAFKSDAPKGEVTVDTVRAVLTFEQEFAEKQAWTAALAKPKEAAHRWLTANASANAIDMQRPQQVNGAIQVIVRVSKAKLSAILCASGKNGVFVRLFFDGPGDRDLHKVVPLDIGCNLQEACRKAAQLGEVAAGVCRTRKGLGVRVSAGHHATALKQLRPQDHETLTGNLWEVTGLPLSMGEDALGKFLGDWQAIPVRTYRQGYTRTWVVRSSVDPARTKIQHDFGLALVRAATSKPKPVEKKTWKPEHKTVVARTGTVQWPKAWEPPAPSAASSVRAHVPQQRVDASLPGASAPPAPVQHALSPDVLAEAIKQAVTAAIAPLQLTVSSLQQEVTAMKSPDGEVLMNVDPYATVDVHAEEPSAAVSASQQRERKTSRSPRGGRASA